MCIIKKRTSHLRTKIET